MRFSKPVAPGRAAQHEPPHTWGTRHLAATLLGARDPRRAGSCAPHRLLLVQSRQARTR
jgi:hypothetical protein